MSRSGESDTVVYLCELVNLTCISKKVIQSGIMMENSSGYYPLSARV